MRQVKTGDTLIHPAHGEMKVTNVDHRQREEYIDAQQGYQQGYEIEAVFDRFIPGIRWVAHIGPRKVSKLIFHSWYLNRLELRE